MKKGKRAKLLMNKKSAVLRDERGFTLAETLIVIGIIAILAAFGFVNVVGYRRQLHLREMDDTARQIFIAAQNHLTVAEASGAWDYDKLKDQSDILGPKNTSRTVYEKIKEQTEKDGDTVLHDWRVITVKGDASDAGALSQYILPFGAIDESVRRGRQYLILYDAKTATINGVFYTDSTEDTLTFEAATNLYANYIYPTEQRGPRRTLITRRTVVGWYGPGEAEGADESGLKRPVVTVDNSETLALNIVDPNNDNKVTNPSETANTRVKLVFKGLQSGKTLEYIVPIDTLAGPDADFNSSNFGKDVATQTVAAEKLNRLWTGKMNADSWYYRIYLDSITLPGAHFAEVFGPAGFIPGEDVNIAVSVVKDGKESKATEVTTNSLFGTLNGSTAEVRNGRHLQNLDPAISNLGNADPSGKVPVTAADLQASVAWTDGVSDEQKGKTPDAVKDFWTNLSEQTYPLKGTDDPTAVVKYQSPSAEAPAAIPEKSFYGIRNTQLTKLSGNENKLINFNIAENAAGGAGLFASTDVEQTLTIEDVIMISPTVHAVSTGGNAGALVGTANGTLTVNRSGAYSASYADGQGWIPKLNTSTTTTAANITAKGAAGGLVGLMAGGGSLDLSMASLYVNGENAAGGLVGSASGSTEIRNSYVGGRTAGVTEEVTELTGQYKDEKDEAVVGHYNVYSRGAAGGLVGSGSGLNIQNSYTTASAKAEGADAAAGGLVGRLSDTASTIAHSYATGLVGGADGVSVGAFVGAGSYAANASDGNYYISIVNGALPTMGGSADDPAGLLAADGDLKTYNSFVNALDVTDPEAAGYQEARSYDPGLEKLYNGQYAYQEIRNMTNAPDWLKCHYGDWPAPETLVVNVG